MDVKQFAELATVGVGLVQQIPSMVQAVENAFPTGTPGAQKLDAVKTLATQLAGAAGAAATVVEQAWPAISAIVSALVSAYNASGLFKKTSP